MEQEEEESKTIMLRSLPVHVTEEDIRAALEQLEGPQPVDIRLMKKRTGERCCSEFLICFNAPSLNPLFLLYYISCGEKKSY